MSNLKIYGVPLRAPIARSGWPASSGSITRISPSISPTAVPDPGYSPGESERPYPAIDDNGFELWESMAINLYLAKKHGSGLLPKTMEDEAQAIQWSFWVMTEVEKPALAVLLHRFSLPEDQRDSKLADEGEQQLQKPLEVLDQGLATTGYLVGPTFTVADLNVASVLSWARMGGVDLSGFPATWINGLPDA